LIKDARAGAWVFISAARRGNLFPILRNESEMHRTGKGMFVLTRSWWAEVCHLGPTVPGHLTYMPYSELRIDPKEK